MLQQPTTQPPPGATARAGWLLRHAKRWILALALLMVAVSMAVASTAVFTSKSANPNNTFAAGTLSESNSKAGAAILNAGSMLPGSTQTGTVTIKNTGTVGGAFTLSSSSPADVPGPNGGKLSTVLMLLVHDNAAADGTDVYSGPFKSMPVQALGTWAAGESHTYTFTVTFPQGGTPGSATTGDNAFLGSTTSATYTWAAQSL